MPRKEVKGAAETLTLSGDISDSATSFSSVETPGAGWPTGTGGKPFVVRIDNEKILCSARTAGSFTVTTRGYDGTTAAAHVGNVATIKHTLDAVSLDEFFAHIYSEGSAALHAAGRISSAAAGTLASTNVQAALEELDTEKSAVGHTHTASNVTDFAEVVRDTIGTALTAGANIAVTVNDAGDTITVAVTGLTTAEVSGLTEFIQDTIGALTGMGGSGLTWTYSDAGNSVTLVVNVDDSTLEISSDALRVKADGIGMSHISLASNPTDDTDAVRKAYADKAVKTSQVAAPVVGNVTVSGVKTLCTVTITDPGYNIWIEAHASVAAYSTGQTGAWATWSAIVRVDGVIVDRIDIPHSIALQGAAGISFAVPMRRTLKSTGSNTTVDFRLVRQTGDGEMNVGGDGTTNNLQVYWGRQ